MVKMYHLLDLLGWETLPIQIFPGKKFKFVPSTFVRFKISLWITMKTQVKTSGKLYTEFHLFSISFKTVFYKKNPAHGGSLDSKVSFRFVLHCFVGVSVLLEYLQMKFWFERLFSFLIFYLWNSARMLLYISCFFLAVSSTLFRF